MARSMQSRACSTRLGKAVTFASLMARWHTRKVSMSSRARLACCRTKATRHRSSSRGRAGAPSAERWSATFRRWRSTCAGS